MDRSPDEEEQIHVFIREAYPTHEPVHTGIRTDKQVQELKQAFKDAGSPRPSPATKAEVDVRWKENMETPNTDRPTTKEPPSSGLMKYKSFSLV